MRTAWLFPLMKSRVFFEVMRCSPRISVCIYVMIYIMAKCVNEQPRSRFQVQLARNGERGEFLQSYMEGRASRSWRVLFQWKEEPTAISTELSAMEGSVSRDCALCGCLRHGQPLLKRGWEADGCLQDLVLIVREVL